MKNYSKFLGIIAFLAIIGLILTGCGRRSPSLRVVNKNDEPIHYVEVWGLADVGGKFYGLNIVKGSSQTFTLSEEWDDYNATVSVDFGVHSASIEQRYGGVHLRGGEIVTVTLTKDGNLVE